MINKKVISSLLFLFLLTISILFSGCNLVSYCEIIYGNSEDCPMIYGKPMVFHNENEIGNNGNYNFGENIIYLPSIANTEGKTSEFTIKNVGTHDMVINEISISDNNAYLLDTTNTIIQEGIPPKKTTSFKVRFLPTTRGNLDSNITIVYKTGNNESDIKEYTFDLSGMGTAPEITITQNTEEISEQQIYEYDPTIVGDSINASFTIENSGTEELTINDLNLYNFYVNGYPTTSNYSFILNNQNTLPITLQPGETIDFSITYEPQDIGTLTADLIISNDDFYFDNPFDFKLHGYVRPQRLIIKDEAEHEISEYNFGEVVQNTSSELKTFTIQNTGMNYLDITSFTFSNTTEFTYDTISSMTLAPDEEVDFKVQFKPTNHGSEVNTILTINSNSIDSDTKSYTFYGTGVNYNLLFKEINTDSSDAFYYPDEVANGRNYQISGEVQNDGLDNIERSFNISIYISDDTNIDPDNDVFLKDLSIDGVGGNGGTTPFNTNIVIPDEVYEGTRYFGFIVDNGNTIPETDETDNKTQREYTQIELGVIYVSTTTGNDSNDGSITNPVATIGEGINKAQTNYDLNNDIVELRVAEGTYDEQVDLMNRMSLVGGYSTDWSDHETSNQDEINYPTILKNTSGTGNTVAENYTLKIGSGVNSYVYVFYMMIGANDSGAESVALLMEDDASAHIQQNDIYVGDADTSYAVYMQNSSIGYFINNYINDDFTSHPTPGINSTNTYGFYITGNVDVNLFNNFKIEGGYGQNSTAIYASSTDPDSVYLGVNNNTIIGGYNQGNSYGIYLGDNVSANIYNNNEIFGSKRESTFTGGVIGTATAIYNGLSDNVTIINNSINGGLDGKDETIAIDNNNTNSLLILKNQITGGAGAINSIGVLNSDNSNPILINNLIEGGVDSNTTSKAIMNGNLSDGNITNNTIYGGNGSTSYCIENTNTNLPIEIQNNILFSNAESDNYGITNSPNVVTNNNIFVTNDLGDSYIGTDGNIFAEPSFTDVSSDDYSLLDSTPISITEGGLDLTTDLVNLIVNLSIPWLDSVNADDITDLNNVQRTAPWSMGAYENDNGSNMMSIYVSAQASDTNTNGTKQNPYNNITDGFAGFNLANMDSGDRGGTIKLAGNFSLNSNIQIMENISLEGGYNPVDWANDGSTTTLDLTTDISGTNGNPNGVIVAGTGVTDKTSIKNLTITTSNQGDYLAGILCKDAYPTIQNNVINMNIETSKTEMYGIYNEAMNVDISPNITQNTIYYTISSGSITNSYGIYNKAMSSFECNPVITQNSIVAGDAVTESAGIKNEGELCNSLIQNNIEIVGGANSTNSYGIYNLNSSANILDNTTSGTNEERCIRPGTGATNSYGIMNESTLDTAYFIVDITNNLIGGGDGVTKSVGIYSANSSSSTTLDVTIDNNDIDGGGNGGTGTSYGIENTTPGNETLNINIQNNQIIKAGNRGGAGSVTSGIFNHLASSSITGNDLILGGNGETAHAIQSDSIDLQIIGNRISGEGTNTAYGIYYTNSTGTANTYIFNNVISGGNSGITNTFGIYYEMSAGEVSNIINNTIDGGGGIISKGISLDGSIGTTNLIENNIVFSSTSDANDSYALYEESNSSSATSIKNNNIFDCDYAYYDSDSGGDSTYDVAGLNTLTTIGASDNVGIDLIDANNDGDDIDSFFVDYSGSDNDIYTILDNDWQITSLTDVNVRAGAIDHITIFTDISIDDVDIAGNPRTNSYFGNPDPELTNNGQGWTIGAYEQDY